MYTEINYYYYNMDTARVLQWQNRPIELINNVYEMDTKKNNYYYYATVSIYLTIIIIIKVRILEH